MDVKTGTIDASGGLAVGTVVHFVGDAGDRAGETWVLVGRDGTGDPEFRRIHAGESRPQPSPGAICAAAERGDAEVYDPSPRYPPAGRSRVPGTVESWDPPSVCRRLAAVERSRAGGDGDGGTPDGGTTTDGREALARALEVGRHAAALTRQPAGAIAACRDELLGERRFDGVLYSELYLHEHLDGVESRGFVPEAVAAAREFVETTTGAVPRVAVPDEPGAVYPFRSVPFVATAVTRGMPSDDGGHFPTFEHPPILATAYRQAWYSDSFEVTLVDVDYGCGAVTIRVSESD